VGPRVFRSKQSKEEHDAHHQILAMTPSAVALQYDAWAHFRHDETACRNSQQDEIVVDIGVALEGNKDGQFKQKYDEVAKGGRSLKR